MNPAVYLKKNLKRRIFLGHPWIYDNEIEKADPVEDGGIVDVFSDDKHFVGRGYYNSSSLIRVRLLTRKYETIDESFFFGRIKAALDFRLECIDDTGAMRVVFGESDGLPGLIVDKFSDYIVMQIGTLGMNMFKEHIVNALVKLFNPKGIYEKSEGAVLSKEGLKETRQWLYKNGPVLIPFKLHDIKFLADLEGQKTGFFLDQRDNALKLAGLSSGKRALDVFSYTGNFSFHLLKAGASHCTLVDASERALDVAREIARLNGFEDKVDTVVTNAFDYMRTLKAGSYDEIIVDPPSMTKSSKSRKNAVRGYKEINVRTLKALRNQGIFATSSCTQIVHEDEWNATIAGAFNDTKTIGKIIVKGGQPVDHPALTSVFETHYLKFMAYKVLKIQEL